VQLKPLAANSRFYWRVSALNQYGEGDFSQTANFLTGDFLVDINEPDLVPAKFILEQNFPNPFNPSTKISWQSPVSSFQIIKVFDVLGNEVETLLNEYKPAGNYEIQFNAKSLPSGVYFYRLVSGDFIQQKNDIYKIVFKELNK